MIKAALVFTASCLAASSQAETLLFDFGSIDHQTTDLGWNNVTHTTGSPATGLSTVVDSTGSVVSGLSLEITDQFFFATQSDLLGTDTPTGDATGLPSTATEDFFLGHTGSFLGNDSTPTAAFKLTGLDPSLTYSFTFFSSRDGVSDIRETAFSITGDNSAQGLLDASNNDSSVLTLTDIVPDSSNEILIELSAGPNNTNSRSFYYLNALQVDIVPEPGALSLITLAGLLIASRRPRRA